MLMPCTFGAFVYTMKILLIRPLHISNKYSDLPPTIKGQRPLTRWDFYLKFIYSEKETKFCEISTVDLTITTYDKSTMEISQNFVVFSEYMNFKTKICTGVLMSKTDQN